jgi:hypothetical protein
VIANTSPDKTFPPESAFAGAIFAFFAAGAAAAAGAALTFFEGDPPPPLIRLRTHCSSTTVSPFASASSHFFVPLMALTLSGSSGQASYLIK